MKLSSYEDQSNPPANWLGKVSCDKVIDENALGFATIVVGENGYNNHIHTIRQYESILANCITFIDNDFDAGHTIYDNEFLYVHSGKELENKIKQLRNDKSLYENCILSQMDFIDRKSKVNYVDQLLSYIKEKIHE